MADPTPRNTAATANTNPSDDVSRVSQTASNNSNGRFTVQQNGEDSTVTDTLKGEIVFSGPADRAVSQAAELNRQAGGAYNQASVVSTARSDAVSKDEDANLKKSTSPENADITSPRKIVGRSGQLVEFDADKAKNIVNLQVGGNKGVAREPIPNPLDNYASYTYALTLFALTKNDFNTLVDSPTTFNPNKALISSAGRYQSIRDSNFKEDFYFDNFKLTTVIGLNANTRGTNAINMSFSIIEPYGMTLLDRIMNIAMNELAAKNYLDIPYLLRVEFFGYDDQGNPKKLTEHTKNFPIKLVNFKIKASVKGAEYDIQAVPFNHGANLESIQALKTRMEVTADTVKSFFQSTETANADTTTLDDTTRTEANRLSTGVGGGRGSAVAAARDPRLLGATPVEETASSPLSFTAAYNAWNIASTKNGDAKFADQIKFVIDADIANSKIADPKSTTVKRSGVTSAQKEGRSSDTTPATLDTSKVVHSFEAGTTVNEIINAIIPTSEFFLKQVKDPAKDAKSQVQDGAASDATVQAQAEPVKMWKIVPSIKLGEFDTERNVWGKIVTFNVGKYSAYQQRDPRLPKSPPPNAVKRYDYFYTGHNTSVINFDIDFNALYFTATQVDRGNTETTAGTKAKPDTGNKDSVSSVGGKSGLGAGERKENTGSQMQTGVGGANNRSETQNAQSALQSIYTSAAGDMINLKLQIIGDPHFIKQDDLFIVADVKGSQDTFVSAQIQSLNMDSGEIYCYVTFKTPSDFSETTGLYNLDSSNPYHTSEFSGYYKVIQVDSEFRGGKFTQTLNLVRYPMQDSPNFSASKNPSLNGDRNEKSLELKKKGVQQEVVSSPQVTEVVVSGANTSSSNTGPDKTADDNLGPKQTVIPPLAETTPNSDEKRLSEIASSPTTLSLDEATPSTGDPVIAPTIET